MTLDLPEIPALTEFVAEDLDCSLEIVGYTSADGASA